MVHEVLCNFFLQFLNQEKVTMNSVASFNERLFVEQETGALVFSLPALHDLLFAPQTLSYSVFIKTLYQGQFNQALQASGGVVSVYQSNGKVDDNLYQLNALVNK